MPSSHTFESSTLTSLGSSRSCSQKFMAKVISSLSSLTISSGWLAASSWNFLQSASFYSAMESTIFGLPLTIVKVCSKLPLSSCSWTSPIAALASTLNKFSLALYSYELHSLTGLNFSLVNLSSTFVMIFASQKILALTATSVEFFFQTPISPLSSCPYVSLTGHFSDSPRFFGRGFSFWFFRVFVEFWFIFPCSKS